MFDVSTRSCSQQRRQLSRLQGNFTLRTYVLIHHGLPLNSKKIILKCLSQTNAHAAQFDQVTAEESSEITGQVSCKLSHGNITNDLQVGYAGSNFCRAVKVLIVEQIREFWPITYSHDEAKQKTVEECMSYMRQRVHNLLHGDAFTLQWSWLSPTGVVSFIHYFYGPI